VKEQLQEAPDPLRGKCNMSIPIQLRQMQLRHRKMRFSNRSTELTSIRLPARLDVRGGLSETRLPWRGL
jgi:hypothetical protein